MGGDGVIGPAKPFVIGLTGGIGAGKSTVLADLVSLGAEGIDADRLAHDLSAPGSPAYAPIITEFGRDILTPGGSIDRSELGRRVFADAAKLAQLEAIIHPVVGAAIAARVAASQAPVVVIEAIKLLEAGLSERLCDEVWVTRCSLRQQIARLRANRGMSEAEVRRRLAAQMPIKQMVSRAHRVIDTGGSRAETSVQTIAAWAKLGLPMPRAQIRAGGLDDADGMATVLNSVVREGGLTILDRTLTAAQQRLFLRRLPPRSRQTLAQIGNVVAGFQFVEPYAQYTGAMDHVGTMGSYVIEAVRGRGLGAAMSRATFAAARELAFSKLVISVRADNRGAQAFYTALGFQPCGRLTRQALVDGGYVDELLYELFLDQLTKDA
jgi:dephospho-CoA kinase